MRFNEATYWPTNVAKPYVDYSLRDIEASSLEELCNWVKKALRTMPVLLYCDDKDILYCRNNIKPAFQINQRGDFKYF